MLHKRAFSFSMLTVAAFAVAACSFYESGGHKAIEKDEGGLVTTSVFMFSGLGGHPLHFYSCERSSTLPEYLKEPLEVIESEYESRGISVMTAPHNTAGSNWVAVYHHDDEKQMHSHCKVYSLTGTTSSNDAILAAARVGVDQITKIETSAARP